MQRTTQKILLACVTNLFGLMVVSAVIGPHEPAEDFFHVPMSESAPVVRESDSWRSAQAEMLSPGRVEDSRGSSHAMSPFGLRALINEHPYTTTLSPLWSWFGIKSALPSQCNPCTAEVFELELDAEQGVETVLRIGSGKSRYQYLFFKQASLSADPSGWKFVGLVDDIAYPFNAPPHFTAGAGGRRWLVLQEQELTLPAGVFYHNRVVEVTPEGVQEVLSYPASGYRPSHSSDDTGFDALLLDADSGRAGDTLKVRYASYHFYGGERAVSRQQTAVFARPKGFRRFVLDLRRSDLSREEFPAVYESPAAEGDDFLAHNYAELADLAARGNETERAWLSAVVSRQGATPRAVALARLLRR